MAVGHPVQLVAAARRQIEGRPAVGDHQRQHLAQGQACLLYTSPGFLFASVAIVVFSLLGKAPSTSMLKRFDDAEQEYREAHQGSAAPVTQR